MPDAKRPADPAPIRYAVGRTLTALERHLAPAARPDWFDPAAHAAGQYGIVETATGALLGDDGLPANGTLRAARLAAATGE